VALTPGAPTNKDLLDPVPIWNEANIFKIKTRVSRLNNNEETTNQLDPSRDMITMA